MILLLPFYAVLTLVTGTQVGFSEYSPAGYSLLRAVWPDLFQSVLSVKEGDSLYIFEHDICPHPSFSFRGRAPGVVMFLGDFG